MRQLLAPRPNLHLPEPEAFEVPARARAPAGYFYVSTPVDMHHQRLHETYLRVYDLDLADSRAIDDFVAAHGWIGVARQPFSSPQRGNRGGFELKYLGFPNGPGALDSELRADRLRAIGAPSPDDQDHSGVWNIEPLLEFTHGATLIKDMVTAWRWVNEDLRPAVADWKALVWRQRHERPPRTKEEATKFLQDYVDEGLEFFPPGLALRGGLRAPWALRPAHQEYFHPVYPVCCLQLANHIFEGARYRRCARTDCPNHFVRQRDRAQHGQHRTRGDLLFCSKRCANTQGARDRRGSKRARPSRGEAGA